MPKLPIVNSKQVIKETIYLNSIPRSAEAMKKSLFGKMYNVKKMSYN
jgi:hypothetical protein